MPATPTRYPLSLHDALPILGEPRVQEREALAGLLCDGPPRRRVDADRGGELRERRDAGRDLARQHGGQARPSHRRPAGAALGRDRKSTRLNSSHLVISYAGHPHALPSFPTRRSSDLGRATRAGARGTRRPPVRRAAPAARRRRPRRRAARASRCWSRPRPSARRAGPAVPPPPSGRGPRPRSEEHTSELQSPCNLVCRPPPRATLFPYTTLFRSWASHACRSARHSPASCATGRPGGASTPTAAASCASVEMLVATSPVSTAGRPGRPTAAQRARPSAEIGRAHV